MLIAEKLKLFYRAARYRWVTDRQEIAFLMRHIRKGDTVMDIGAHKGGYTYWMRQAAGNRGKVIAFEPQAAGASLLRQLFDASVQVENKAVSNEEGITRLFVQPQRFHVSFEASLENKYGDALEQQIETVTLDAFCRRQGLTPALLKIDVEGHEEKLLWGAREVLQHARPFLLMEAEVRHIGADGLQRLFRLLEPFYKGFFFSNGAVQPLSQFDAHRHQDVGRLNTPAYSNNFAFEPR